MWIATTFGFFSVVAHRTLPGCLLVRARVRGDLEQLIKRLPFYPLGGGSEPTITDHTGDSDYRYHAVVPRRDFVNAWFTLVDGIDYDNFKDAVHERQGMERALLYSNVWQGLRALEKLDRPKQERHTLREAKKRGRTR